MGEIEFSRTSAEWVPRDLNGKRVEVPKCEKRSINSITADEFRHEYLERNRPVIFTGKGAKICTLFLQIMIEPSYSWNKLKTYFRYRSSSDALEKWSSVREKWGRHFFKSEFGDKKQHVKLGQNGIFEGPADRSAWEESSLPDFVREKLQFPGF